MQRSRLGEILYRRFIGTKIILDERQERAVNDSLAMCLVYLYWAAMLLTAVSVICYLAGYEFDVPFSVVGLFVVGFVGFFMMFDRTVKTSAEPDGLSPETLPEHLKKARTAVLKGSAVFGVLMGTFFYFTMQPPIFAKAVAIGIVMAVFWGTAMYFFMKHSFKLMIRQARQHDDDKDN